MSTSSDADDFDQDDIDDESDSDSCEADVGVNVGTVGTARGFLVQLKEDIQKAPFDRELHVALIGALREAAKLDALSAVRRQAAARVALPESVWLEWLQDETMLADAGSFGELDALHKAACTACPTSRIWLARCQLHQEEQYGQDATSIRAIYEEALSILGLHPSEGLEVWADYRSFEERLLAAATAPAEQKRLAQRVRALFMRQLALPLPGVARLREAHATFEGSLEPAATDGTALAKADAIANSALASWQEREPLEQRLLVVSRPSVTVGLAPSAGEEAASPASVSAEILAAEEASGDQGRIFAGHLRATHYAPQEVSRWQRFADFTANTLNDRRRTVEVLERGVRHCMRSGELWLQLHMEHEGAATPLPGLRGVLERGVAALGSTDPEHETPDAAAVQELLMQHADAVRRAFTNLPQGEDRGDLWKELRAAFDRAVKMAEAPGADGSSCCSALMRWMRLEAYAVRDLEGTLTAGRRLMKLWGGYYNVWSSFIAAVLHCSGANAYTTVRGLYAEAMAQVADYPDQVRTDYLQFERELGTLRSWRQAQRDLHRQAAAAAAQTAQAAVEAEGQAAAAAKVDAAIDGEATLAASTEPTAEEGEAQKSSTVQPKRARPKKRPRNAPASEAGKPSASPVSGPAGDTPPVGPSAPAAAAVPGQSGPDGAAAAAPDSRDAGAAAIGPAAPSAKDPQDHPPAPAGKSDEGEQPEPASKGDSAEPPRKRPHAGKQDQDTPASKGGDAEPPRSRAHAGSHYHQKRSTSEPAAPECLSAEGEHTVYVSNLDWSVDEAQLHRIFFTVDGLKEVRLVRDFLQRSKGYAYIDFQTSEQVEEAVRKLNGFLVNKRPMRVARSLPTRPLFEERTVFVRNVSATATEQDVKDTFAPLGEVVGVRIPMDATTKVHKGYAYVEFTSADAVKAALAKEGIELAGSVLEVCRSIPMKDHRHQTAAPRKDMPQRANQREWLESKMSREDPVRQSAKFPTTVHVKNLAFKVDEAALRVHFASCGEVSQVLLVRNAQGKSRGFGFVEFAEADGAQAALLLTDSELGGREVVVSRSQRAITQKKSSTPAAGGAGEGQSVPVRAAALEGAAPRKRTAGEGPAALQGPEPGVAVTGPAKRLRLDAEAAAPRPAAEEPPQGPAAAKAKAAAVHRPFRTTKLAEQEPQGQDQARAAGGAAGDDAAPKPMTNADFRAMVLGSGQMQGGQEASSGATGNGAPKPMTNADFRALVLGAAQKLGGKEPKAQGQAEVPPKPMTNADVVPS